MARLISCEGPAHDSLVQVEVSLGDGHDTVAFYDVWYQWKVYGGSGNDRIDISFAKMQMWGPGGQIYAGPGRDNINTQNGNYDEVDCGAGADVVKADPFDWLIGC